MNLKGRKRKRSDTWPFAAVFTADAQVPYHDPRVVSIIAQVISDMKPCYHIELGDRFDFHCITTKFLKKASPVDQLLRDRDTVRLQFAETMPHVEHTVYIEGNHEDRLLRYILSKAPELEAFTQDGEALDVKTFLGIPEIEYVGPYGAAWILGGKKYSLVCKHGDRVNKYAAFSELDDEGSSGISGHTHRMQVFAHTDRSGSHAWYSMPCMCNIVGKNTPPGYKKGENSVRNWQQGFAIGYFDEDVFNIYPVVVTDGKCVTPDGKVYKA